MASFFHPIAYFCAEYALPDLQYVGGLGILAADYLKEANDLHVPVVAFGLHYGPTVGNLETLKDDQGKQVEINISIQDRTVKVKVIKYPVGSVLLYLLDTHVEGNSMVDQQITEMLYDNDKETRLKQEMVLGIGGMRLLEYLKLHPSTYHLNEGHSAFLTFDLIYHQMKERGIGFVEAQSLAKRQVVFTNHTLVAAGDEVYADDLVSLMLSKYSQDLGIPVSELIKLGLVQESSSFSLTMLSLRMSGVVNAVSQLHAKKAGEIWKDHPMIPITNGIHIPTWDCIHDKTDLILGHAENKQLLLKTISQHRPDWQGNFLLIGWARRFVQYKRPLSIFENMDRLLEIAHRDGKEVKFVFSGRVPEGDQDGKKMLDHLNEMANLHPELVMYLPEYNSQVGKMLTSGCDVWLNTPIVGFEACGTSGMKAALNGTLPCSTKDGWIDEIELFKVGWTLDSDHITDSFLDTLDKHICPMFFDRPAEWQEMMRNGRTMVLNQFSATRMLNEYVHKLYL
jgi:glycogen phosphorylase